NRRRTRSRGEGVACPAALAAGKCLTAHCREGRKACGTGGRRGIGEGMDRGRKAVSLAGRKPAPHQRSHAMKTVALLALIVFVATIAAAPPVAKKVPVTDTYHGVAVVDPYRWLEDASNKEVQEWSDAQNANARAYLDKLPGVDSLRDRIKEIVMA